MNFTRECPEMLPRIVSEGDVVICYQGHNTLDFAVMKAGESLHNRFGTFRHDDIIGKPFGHKIRAFSGDSNQFIFVLEPTPELWSTALKTRTQIVDEMDASLVTFMLNVSPGSRVIESGTGSGCMTLSLARAVNHKTKAGHVFTYEYNPVRAKAATDEFKTMGVGHCVTVQCMDVCAKYDKEGGGGFPGVEKETIDAVFLDLPEPWLALPQALELMKPNGRICCYSPCIEQVIDTCAKLRELGFHSIRMFENKQRTSDTKLVELEEVDLGLETIKGGEVVGGEEQTKDNKDDESRPPSSKKRKVADGGSDSTAAKEGEATVDPEKPRYWVKKEMPSRTMKVNRANQVMKGHTAFLTFAHAPVAK
jgi:tRNA (adenine57-N1/adenine58-N1)-methyltransferase